jgi:hypothetical protein
MPIKHEKELRDFADEATKLAELIHQDWGSGAPEGGVQTRVNVDMPKHGPDHALLEVERALGSVVAAISEYRRRPSES